MGYPYVGPVANDSGTGNLPLNRIVIHCTVGTDGSGAAGTAAYFRDPNAKGSAHSVVDSDEVLICAYDNVICWHAPPNSHSYGIELCCSLAEEGKGHWTLASHVSMMKLAAKLTAEKCLQHNIPVVKLSVADLLAGKRGICGHIDVSNAFKQSSHWDPGPYFPWDQFMSYVRAEYAALTGTGDDVALTAAQEAAIAKAGWLADQFAQGAQFEEDLDRIEAAATALQTAVTGLAGVVNGLVTAVAALPTAAAEGARYADLKNTITTWAETRDTERQTVLLTKLDELIAAVNALPKA